MKLLHFFYLTVFFLFSNVQAATIYEIQDGVSVYADTVVDKRRSIFRSNIHRLRFINTVKQKRIDCRCNR